jgi:Protein of unknown function (DUF3486)
MGRKSTIATNPVIQEAVNSAISRGHTIDAIKEMLDAMSAEISRSAIGRYASKYQDIVARNRDIRAAADAFAGEFANASDNQTRLLVQMITTLITENIMQKGEGEGSAMDLRLLAAAVKDALGAAKIDNDLRAKIRKEEQDKCKAAAERALASTGGTAEQMEALRLEFLGLAA